MTSAATMTRDQSMLVALICDGGLTAKRLISANCADVPVRGQVGTMGSTDKLRDKLTKLFRLLGSSNTNECEAARSKIDELLAKNKKNWTTSPSSFPSGTHMGGKTTMTLAARVAESIRAE